MENVSKTLNEKLGKFSKEEQKLWALRHTAEHVLHTALQNLYPSMKKAMGPATNDGYYHDFDLGIKISEADFPKIEKEMQKLIDADLPLIQEEITVEKAKELFKDNPYKLDWVKQIEERDEKVSIYKMGDQDLDLCSGPHAKSTGEIKAFKLLSVAGAYWHGDEKNKMLTRIYGTAFPSREELDEYLNKQKLMEERDHRKLGKDLDLFVFSDLVGKGLPFLTPKGAVIRRELERFVVDEEIKRGYEHVYTPPLAKTELYKTSGHYPYYKETMYPVMKVDEEELILRPMTCPHHFMLYQSRAHSYRELPVRYAEISPQFRYEKSGELSGLIRVRTFCLADAHLICTKEQAKSEIIKVLDLIDYANSKLGFVKGKDYRYRLSLGDRNDSKKYYKDDAAWDFAENILREVLKETEAPFFEAKDEAAFYGPKIDIQMKRVNGAEETAFTVQYDFVMPKRFKLEYVDEKSETQEPVVIHRSSIGAFERTMSFLIEHYAGSFPTWLAPVQAMIIPISEKHLEYAQEIQKMLLEQNIRVELDDKNATMQEKIREATLQKIPYMIILGTREIQNKNLSIRTRKGQKLEVSGVKQFTDLLNREIKTKSSTV